MHTTIIFIPVIAITQEIAASFGFRDRCLGIDAEARGVTLDRFHGAPDLERAYFAGWIEAETTIANAAA